MRNRPYLRKAIKIEKNVSHDLSKKGAESLTVKKEEKVIEKHEVK